MSVYQSGALIVAAALGVTLGACQGRGPSSASDAAPHHARQSKPQRDIEREILLAQDIFRQRFPSYLRRYPNRYIAVMPTGEEFVDASVIELERRVLTLRPKTGFHVGDTFPRDASQ